MPLHIPRTALVCLVLAAALRLQPAVALDYAYATAEPQKTGWPLSADEEAYVLKPEYERRPGAEITQHKPELWPVVPAAGFWGGRSWLDTHANLVKVAEANKGPIDVLLVGDSITMQWGAAWQKHFGTYKTVNIGIGGDKTQNVLWRLDHGGVAGLEPKLCVLMIGNNNCFFTPETGIEPAAKGIKACADNLREKFPKAQVVVVKVLPAHAPGHPFYEDIKKVNAALDGLDADPMVHLLDLTADFVNADGTLKKNLFSPDNIHLTQEGGYELYATRLKPLVEKLLGTAAKPAAPAAGATPAGNKAATAAPTTPSAQPPLRYPYAPYHEGRMDPQLTGWPLAPEEHRYVQIAEYRRKPGHESQKHLPDMWPVVPTANHWGKPDQENIWIDHHASIVDAVRAAGDNLGILLLGDSITQGWGGSPIDKSPVGDAWHAHFADQRMVNAGIGGDRTENLLWRLEHGLLEGVSPRAIVLMIGVNNAPLVSANGVPAEAVAKGIALCVENIRRKSPQSEVVVVKILPAFAAGSDVHASILSINAALDRIDLARDPHVHVIDAGAAFLNADGSLKTEPYSDGHLHLSATGYQLLADALKPVLDRLNGR